MGKKRLMGLLVLLILIPSGCLTTGPVDPKLDAKWRKDEGLKAIQQGAFEKAIRHLTESVELSKRAGKIPEQLETYVDLSEAYLALGQYRKALETLESAGRLAEEIEDQQHLSKILGTLGHLYFAEGQETEAFRYLSAGLQRSKQLGQDDVSAAILNNLGMLWARQKKYDEAIQAYAESANLAQTSLNRPLLIRTLTNSAMTSLQMKQYTEAKDRLDQAFDKTQELSASQDKSYDLITIGLTYYKLRPSLSNQDQLLLKSYEALKEAAATADAIKSARASSYAFGYLGWLYENDHQYEDALDLTRQAILFAQRVAAPEALYRWHWQAARLFKTLGQQEEALAAYRRAVSALQAVRMELTSTSSDSESSFRETVGAVYFELADLLLQRAASYEQAKSEPYLKEARDIIELFKVAELRDYFQDDCVDAARSRATTIESLSENTAVVYPIVLADRTELLVSLRTGIQRVSVSVQADALIEEIRLFRNDLEKRSTHEYLPHAQQLYAWLVRPLEPLLNGLPIDTLVFVPDGALRTISLAALHDGKEFLITKYAVAVTPGLTLTDPRPLRRERVLAFSGGLTEAVQGFPALPNVFDELQTVKNLYGGTLLLNKNFLVSKVERALKEQPFSIVHIASHSQFESDVKKSFLLTFDDQLSMDQLDQFVGLFRFRDEPLALLTLSACETAAGDDQAALGLAGVAIKAGARSALATLWFINDEASSALVSEFYRQLHDSSASKAVALQRAQLMLLKHPIYRHPAYWAPFLLLNNWL